MWGYIFTSLVPMILWDGALFTILVDLPFTIFTQ